MDKKPEFIWDVGTAYDFFISLDVLHHPDRYALRGNWAAGVRSRLPAKKRELLQTIVKANAVWPIPWLARLPVPHKDVSAVLNALAAIPASERLPEMTRCYLKPAQQELLHCVAARGTWDDADLETLRDIYKEIYRKENKKRKITDDDLRVQLRTWANPGEFGEGYLAALQTYYEVFFAEDEQRILPALQETMVQAQQLTAVLTLPELLEELSQGLQFDVADLNSARRVRMAPSFWTTMGTAPVE